MTDAHGPSYQLLTILQHHAPDGPAQQTCSDLYSQLQKDGISGNQLELEMAFALVDGLRYGNWPWTPLPERQAIQAAVRARENDE